MISAHPLLKINIREQLPRQLIRSPHLSPRTMPFIERITPPSQMPPTSSTACQDRSRRRTCQQQPAWRGRCSIRAISEAVPILEPVYDRINEGFGTADLKAA